MARFQITGPDGGKFEITAPDGATEQDVLAYAQRSMSAKPKPDVGMIPAGLEGIAQGLTFNLSDELEGAARAAYGKITGDSRSFGDLYNEGVAIPRKRIADAKASQPVAFGVGEIGGGVALPLGAARLGVRGALAANSGAGLGTRTVAGIGEGAAYGAGYGAGGAEGGLAERAAGAGWGAGVGGALGGVMPAAVDAAGAIGSRIAAPFRAAANPERFAAEKVGEAIARDNPVGGAERFGQRFQNMADINPAARVMDAGGDNMRGLMRAANNMPNAERDTVRRAVDTRQGNQYARIENALTENMGEGQQAAKQYFDQIARLTDQMDAIGADKIRPALQIETPMTPRLASVLDRPTAKALQEKVQRRLADEGLPIGFETRTEMLHRLKVELDDQIGMSKRAEAMGNTPQAGMDTRTLTILKRDLLNSINNDSYKAGLKEYASTAQLKNAVEDGYDAFRKMQPEEIRATLAGMESKPLQDFYRFGALRAVVEQLRKGNANRDRTDGMFSSPEMQLKMKAIFPSQEQFRAFQQFLVTEAKMSDSRKALQGNSTTARQLAEGGEADKTAGMITSLMNAAGGSWQQAMNLLARGYNRFTGMTPDVAAETLRLGASRDPAAINSMIRDSAEAAAQVPGRRAAAADRNIAGGAALMNQARPLQVTVYPPGDPRND